ncbi:hypothetical protein NESM_000597800 [Novymonas esmeraldas]|uniref:Proteasome activator complex subunit 4 C-terminal domain-containing protein n=1 Tax=Novymonas esmeraldas TaxID=1808958 RepID=A0AAW0EUY1_9TRYP
MSAASSSSTSSLELSDGDDAWTAASVGEARLGPKERIHRFIDECVPPDLLAHERATDGVELARLCAELATFGLPHEWAPYLPATVLDDYTVIDVELSRIARTSSSSAAPPAEVPTIAFEKLLYTCKHVAYPPHPSLEELRRVGTGRGSRAVGSAVAWSTLVQHLHALAERLHRLLTTQKKQGGVYVLPPRLQASIVPVLYAWVTHWGLVEADVECWEMVASTFVAACRSPRRTDAAAPLLPWQPLAALCRSTLEPSNVAAPSWQSTMSVVSAMLPQLCRRASPHLGPDAVDGLWRLLAADLTPTEDGAAALSLFVRLVPYRYLCEPREATVAVAAAVAPRLTRRAAQVLQFLLVEAATWDSPAPPSLPLPAVERKGGGLRGLRERAAPQRLWLSWDAATIVFVGSLARAHPGVAGIGEYAEPLFTAWLRALRLPLGSGAGLPGASASAAAAVSRVVRLIDGDSASSAFASHATGAAASAAGCGAGCTATSYVKLLSAFPGDTVDSPLWRHLERWLHATSVLVRPGMPCPKGSPADRVCACYLGIATEAMRRHRTPARHGGAACAGDTPAVAPAANSARYWSPATVEHLVALLLPHAVAAFNARARQARLLLCALLRLSPSAVLPAVLRCVRTGLESPTEVAAQRVASTMLLTRAVPALLAGTTASDTSYLPNATRGALLAFVRATLPSTLSFISASDPACSTAVVLLVTVSLSFASAAEVLGTTAEEVDAFARAYVARLLPLAAARADAGTGRLHHVDVAARVLLQALPSFALSSAARLVLREAQSRDHAAHMAGLVRAVAAHAPAEAWGCAEQHWLRVLQDTAAPDADVVWAAPLLAACVADLGDRAIVRVHAAAVWRAGLQQLRFLTSEARRTAGTTVMTAVLTALMRPQANTPAGPRSTDGASAAGEEEAQPTAQRHAADDRGDAWPVSRVCTAAEAQVHVDWPTAEDAQMAEALGNSILTDFVRVLDDVGDGVPLAEVRGFGAAPVAGGGGVASGGVCESASAITSHELVDGALDVLLRVLPAMEWLFIAAAPPAEAEQRRGMPWWGVAPRAAWRPSAAASAGCAPAYTRAALSDVVRRRVSLGVLERELVAPLRRCGVELAGWVGAGAESDDGGDVVGVDGRLLLRLLWWLSAPEVQRVQPCWTPSTPVYMTLKRVLERPSRQERRWLPRVCWADRALRLQVAAVAQGHLPVEPQPFSDAVAVVQCLCMSPRRSVQQWAVRHCVEMSLFSSLDVSSLITFQRRMQVMCAAVMEQWRVGAAEATALLDNAASADGAPGQAGACLSPAAVTATSRLHTVQSAIEGAHHVLLATSMRSGAAVAPAALLESLRFLIHIPEELRTTAVRQLLPKMAAVLHASRRAVSTGAVRAPGFAEALVQLTHEVASTHPVRAVLLLEYARGVLWPSPGRWVALRAVRQLTWLSLSSHVLVRQAAAAVLEVLSVPVAAQDAVWTTCVVAGDEAVPESLLLSPSAAAESLSAAELQAHHAAVAAVREKVEEVTDACPLLAYAVRERGAVFPLHHLAVPRRTAIALGLRRAEQDAISSSSTAGPRSGAPPTPTFMDAFADTPEPAAAASDAAAEYHRRWCDALLQEDGATLAAGAAASAPPALGAGSWVLRLLAQPVECPQAMEDQHVAPPATVVRLLSSLGESAQLAATLLLDWAEAELQRWRRRRRDAPTRAGGSDGDAAAAAPEVDEDAVHCRFRSLVVVTAAVLQLTAPRRPGTPPPGSATTPELRARAVRLLCDVVMCVCGDAAVSQRVTMRVRHILLCTSAGSLTQADALAVVSTWAAQLGDATGAAVAADAVGDGGDQWSQRDHRLLLFIGGLLGSLPAGILCAILPRLVDAVGEHVPHLSASSAASVRLLTAAVVRRLVALAAFQSDSRAGFGHCHAAADALLSSLLRLSAATSRTPHEARRLSFVAACLQRLPSAMLEAHAQEAVELLCRSLDVSFTEVQQLHEAVDAALTSLATLRMPKPLVHALLEQLCGVCSGETAYGASRRARAACAQTLQRLLLVNLHRIGKFAAVERVASACLSIMAGRDADVRAEGSHMMAVLTKVAAESQVRVLVQRLALELRQLPHHGPAATPTSALAREDAAAAVSTAAAPVGRRVALVQALGAVVLADPGTPPSYVPRVIVQLAGCAREGNTECGRVARRVLQGWWHAHREGWKEEYKRHFTAEQTDAIADLLLTSHYYA